MEFVKSFFGLKKNEFNLATGGKSREKLVAVTPNCIDIIVAKVAEYEANN